MSNIGNKEGKNNRWQDVLPIKTVFFFSLKINPWPTLMKAKLEIFFSLKIYL